MSPEIIVGYLNSQLNDLMKEAETRIIRNYVAHQISTLAHSHKAKIEQAKKQTIQQLIQQSNQFEKGFHSNAKGKWVDSAMTSFLNNKDKLRDI